MLSSRMTTSFFISTRRQARSRTISATWLWRFGLDELPDELGPPTGPAVEMSVVFGMPFARLRAALPDEFFVADLTAALGRRHGFSASGMQASTRWHRDLLNKRKRSKRLSTMKLKGAAGLSDDEGATPMASDLPQEELLRLEEFIGTALVLAFLQVTQLMPVVDIAKRRSAADAHFSDLVSPAGWSFNDTATVRALVRAILYRCCLLALTHALSVVSPIGVPDPAQPGHSQHA